MVEYPARFDRGYLMQREFREVRNLADVRAEGASTSSGGSRIVSVSLTGGDEPLEAKGLMGSKVVLLGMGIRSAAGRAFTGQTAIPRCLVLPPSWGHGWLLSWKEDAAAVHSRHVASM